MKPNKAQQGLSLVELMVAIALGLVVVALVLRTLATTTVNANTNATVSEYQTNGRYAMEVLKRELRHASMRPFVWIKTNADGTDTVNVTATAAAKNYDCGAGYATTNIFVGLEASNDSTPLTSSCLAGGSDRSYSRGDVITTRRTALTQAPSFQNGAPYLRVAYGAGNVFLGQETAPEMRQPTLDYRLANDIYYINAFSRQTGESPRVPALYRLKISDVPNPKMTPELIASNIEHLQVQFGVRNSAGSVQYINPDSITASNRESIVSARIWLLARATTPEAGFRSGSYEMGDLVRDKAYKPNDSFRRLLLTSTINLRNMPEPEL
jgi:type IV pilus assembly protein PilW